VIEILIIYLRVRRSLVLAGERGLSRALWGLLTLAAWFGSEMLVAALLSIPIFYAELVSGVIDEAQSQIGFALFAYLPALIAANEGSLYVHRRLLARSPAVGTAWS
jgi:hypothetical protein